MLRQQQLAAEEERLRKLQEEEERKIREEEERREAELRAIEEEKERKRKAKAAKVEAQKASGTYMTKAEKEKHKKAMARLEAMKAAGMVVPTDEAAKARSSSNGSAAPLKPRELWKKRAGGGSAKSSTDRGDDVETGARAVGPVHESASLEEGDDIPEEKVEVIDVGVAEEGEEEEDEAKEAEGVLDEWDAASDDEWVVNAAGSIAAKVGKIEAESEEVDAYELEKKADQERLRVLGIERARRDEENRIKRYGEGECYPEGQ